MAMKVRGVIKKGDKGLTCAGRGVEKFKTSTSIHFLGELDELNAHIGILCKQYKAYYAPKDLHRIQRHLFQIGASVYDGKRRITQEDIEWLETRTDQMWDSLPQLKNFIYPTPPEIHLVRAVCRRVERSAFEYLPSNPSVLLEMAFLNRLSDYLFSFARYVLQTSGVQESIWEDT